VSARGAVGRRRRRREEDAVKSIVILLLVSILGCAKSEHRLAREKYNEGVDLLVKGDHEAAEKALLDARSAAGVDPELRFRAAYDLGMAYAAHAEKMKTGKDADLNKALELTEQAVSWFSDAARLRKDDKDTQANLAIVRARAQSLSDDLRKGEGKLEARLDALIAQQRSVLEAARGAWIEIKKTGGADPLAQQATLTKLADEERGIVAEAGVVGDLTADEIDTIGKKEEAKRTDEEKVRVVQLKNLELYLMDGRNRIAETRRKLQDLAAEDAVGRAEAALVALKRAREQLLDPITVLREVAQEELVLMQETGAVAQATGGKILDAGSAAPPQPIIPSWVTPAALGERQTGLRDRVEEVRARLAAAVDGPPPAEAQQNPEAGKMLERVKVALPFVTAASESMRTARTRLDEKKLPDAATAERDALVALATAIEQFADLKQTIDLASETQKRLVTLLSPEAAKDVPAAERVSETKDGMAHNVARMPRIKDLLVEEIAKLDAQPPPKDDDKDKDAKLAQVKQMKEMMATAEGLRAEAEKLVGATDAAIKANKDPLTPAKAADAKLDELRRLFFSVIEHLQDLIRQQGETRDQTSAAHAEDDATRAPKLPNLSARQTQHDQLAKAITDALAAQADAAAKAQDPQQQQQAKNMSAAADEVRLAQNDMGDAKRGIDKAKDTTKQSVSLEPVVKSQASALEHLMNALKLLQPPQENKDQKQDQKDQKQDQQQQQAKPDKKQQEQGGAGQRARDDDARRQKERREREQQSDGVETDW
jgi:Ca-activated chloride channel homolog